MEFQHELIIPNEGVPFKLFIFEGMNGNYAREKHWHTSVEIFAVQEGHLSLFLNDQEYPLEAGELIIINSNEVHSVQAPQEPDHCAADPFEAVPGLFYCPKVYPV